MAYDKMPRIHIKPESRSNAMHYCPPSMDRSIRKGNEKDRKGIVEYYDSKPEIQDAINKKKFADDEFKREVEEFRKLHK